LSCYFIFLVLVAFITGVSKNRKSISRKEYLEKGYYSDTIPKFIYLNYTSCLGLLYKDLISISLSFTLFLDVNKKHEYVRGNSGITSKKHRIKHRVLL